MAPSVIPSSKWIVMDEEIQDLMAVFPDIVRDIKAEIAHLNFPDFEQRIEKVFQYNITTSKKLHGILLTYTYQSVAPDEQLTKENLYLARILAWCVEMVCNSVLLFEAISYLSITDDLMDKSTYRRGIECWYRHNNVGLMAINDSFMIESAIYCLLRKYFKGKEYYNDILELFQKNLFKITIGQGLDMYMSNCNKKSNGLINLDLYTMDRFTSIANGKSSPFTFVISPIVAMHLAGIKDPETFKQIIPIMFDLGHLYQVQDDYLSIFADFEPFGKDSTDIEEGKCSWMVVKALQHVTPEQRKILDECYGVSDPEKIKRVKQLYIDLDLPNMFLKYEEETYNQLCKRIQQMTCGLPHSHFLNLLKKLYRRKDCYV